MPINEVNEKLIAKKLLFTMIDDDEMQNYKDLAEDAHKKYDLLNTKNKEKDTPLMYALKRNKLKAARILLEAKADPNIPNNDTTPLLYTLRNHNNAAVRLLLDHYADAGLVYKQDWPLQVASDPINSEAIDYLLEAKANPDFRVNNTDRTLLQKLCSYNHNNSDSTSRIEIAKRLISAKADINVLTEQGDNLLHLAIKCYHGDMVKPLLELKANPEEKSKDGNTPLHLAMLTAYAGITEAKELINAVSSLDILNNDGETPLMIAIKSYHTADKALALIDAKASLCAGWDTLLIDTIKKDDRDHFDKLISLNAVPNQHRAGLYVLEHAMHSYNSSYYVTKLLEAKADPNGVGLNGRKFFNTAVSMSDLQSLGLLIKAKADLNNFDRAHDSSPIIKALYLTEATSMAFLKTLLAAKADPNLGGADKNTPPIGLTSDRNTIETLLEAKADINTPNSSGNTALHLAVLDNDIDKVKLLLMNEANPMLKNHEGLTALAIARQKPGIAKILQDAMPHDHATAGFFSRFFAFGETPETRPVMQTKPKPR